jgi:hypothetical protein
MASGEWEVGRKLNFLYRKLPILFPAKDYLILLYGNNNDNAGYFNSGCYC